MGQSEASEKEDFISLLYFPIPYFLLNVSLEFPCLSHGGLSASLEVGGSLIWAAQPGWGRVRLSAWGSRQALHITRQGQGFLSEEPQASHDGLLQKEPLLLLSLPFLLFLSFLCFASFSSFFLFFGCPARTLSSLVVPPVSVNPSNS